MKLQFMSEDNQEGFTLDISAVKKRINQIGGEFSLEDRRQNKCRYVNGMVLTKLTNDLKLPGILYTLQPDRQDNRVNFKSNTWLHHSVGIIKMGEDKYLAFDQTNSNIEDGKSSGFFFKEGTISDISKELGNRFGSIWDLEFKTGKEDEDKKLTVKGKIDQVEKLIKDGKKFQLLDVTPESFNQTDMGLTIEQKWMHKPLGLKFIPPGIINKGDNKLIWDRFRPKVTYGYA